MPHTREKESKKEREGKGWGGGGEGEGLGGERDPQARRAEGSEREGKRRTKCPASEEEKSAPGAGVQGRREGGGEGSLFLWSFWL